MPEAIDQAIHAATQGSRRRATAATGPPDVVPRYFEAVAAHDLDAMAACWAPDGVDHFIGDRAVVGPDGVRVYFAELWEAIPDFAMDIVDYTASEDRCAVRWCATGTFVGPGSFEGFEPTGARFAIEGCDVVTVRDGLIQGNHAYLNQMDVARQLGLMPERETAAERGVTALMNRRTRLARRLGASEPELVADGVWLIRGGFPAKTMNVYLLEDGKGVTVFDAGIEAMTRAVGAAGPRFDGIRRVVLGHAHPDHRGAAPCLHVPVLCHEAERADAEGDGGAHYFDFSKLDFPARRLMPRLLRRWDGGPVEIEGTLAEGDEVAGFRVVHLPGHAPGLIGLWRESDRLALVSDCFYTLDPQTGRHGHPRVPHAAFNQDTEQARASIRKLAELEPAAAWAGHAEPLTGNVREQLERAAAST